MANEGPAAAQQPVAPRGRIPVPHVSPYLQNVGDSGGDIRNWLLLFDVYIQCVERNQDPNSPLQDIDRNVLLISHLGSEGLRSFSTTPDFAEYNDPANPTTYQRLKTMVQEHFRMTPSVFKARFDFVSRTQEPGESIAEYLVALRALLPDCAFGRIPAAEFEDEQLKTQLICHTSDSRARLEIFARRDAMPLRDVVNFLTASEAASRDTKGLGHSSAPSASTLRTRGRGAG